MKNLILRALNSISLLNWVGTFRLSLLLKLSLRILEPCFMLQSFFRLSLCFLPLIEYSFHL